MLPRSVASERGTRDTIAERLFSAAQYTLVVVFGLLPLVFVPVAAAPFEYSKSVFVLVGVLFALILTSLSVLRSGSVSLPRSLSLLLLWGIALATLISALLSEDFRDALIGDTFGAHTAAFVALLALTASAWAIIGTNKATVMRFYVLLAASALILALFHILRLIFGTTPLSLGIFQGNVATPVGGWNDLALFFGLTVLLSLVVVQQLPLTRWGKILFGVLPLAALVMLGVINFTSVWVVLGISSLILIVYSLGRHRFLGTSAASMDEASSVRTNALALLLTLIIFLTSATFFVGGGAIGSVISDVTSISYVEVRPSIEATANVARNVYAENALVGNGPNRFTDAWRTYKDPAINSTIFWDTNFNSGNGYLSTFFVTTGALGTIAWVGFLITFLFFGLRTLIRAVNPDPMWYFVATSAFVGAAYVWLMSLIYTPGPTILFIGAACTGIVILAGAKLGTRGSLNITVGVDRRTGFVLTLVTMGVIIGSVATLYNVGRHYAAAYNFNQSIIMVAPGVSLDAVEAKIGQAFSLYESDTYARRIAEYKLTRINTLLGVAEPTGEQQQQFQRAVQEGIGVAQLAIDLDTTDPRNWATLGSLYSILVSADVEGAYERARNTLERARDLDPANPERRLALAQLETRANNLDQAREYANEAIDLKQNYTEALFFLTQLEIRTGNVNAAVASARAIISLEPQNPARHYQLGVLESSRGNAEAAAQSFERAVALDPDYANARYFLALAYDEQGRSSEALNELQRVLELNPGNENVLSLIEQINSTGSIQTESAFDTDAPPVSDGAATVDDAGDVTTDGAPDTPLLSPVNATAPDEENSEGSAPSNSEAAADPSATSSDGVE